VLVMHWRNCCDSNEQTGPAGAWAWGTAAGASAERPPIMVLASMFPAIDPAIEEAMVPMRPGPCDTGAGGWGGGIGIG